MMDESGKRKAEGRRAIFPPFAFRLPLWSLLVIACAACGAKQPPHDTGVIRTLAVLPLEPAGGEGKAAPPAEAGEAVTAQLYRVLADQTEFRFVPDLTVADAAGTPEINHAGGLQERAVALGKQVGADAVIFGRVFRFQKRVGTEYGATEPASVSFDLALVAVSTGEVIWQGDFNETQEPLSSNLLNWWMFWSAGPHWFSASELAGLGVEKLFGQMSGAVPKES